MDADGLPVTIGIRRGDQRLFHAALPGTSPDNDAWVERKSRVALRFGHSSLHVAEPGPPHREDHRFLVRELARFLRTEPSEPSRRPAPSGRPSRKENQ